MAQTLAPPTSEPAVVEPLPPAASESAKRLNPIKLKQMEERRASIEQKVGRLEAEILELETALSNFVSVEETARQTALLDQRRADLQALMNEWEEVAQLLDANA
jgi:ATP-binding cassette subfamily F protein 3